MRNDELDRLLVERIVLDRLRDAQMGLECHVAQILENQYAEIVGMAGNRRHRQRNLREQPRDIDERQLLERERLSYTARTTDGLSGRMTRKYCRRRRVARQRHDTHVRARRGVARSRQSSILTLVSCCAGERLSIGDVRHDERVPLVE